MAKYLKKYFYIFLNISDGPRLITLAKMEYCSMLLNNSYPFIALIRNAFCESSHLTMVIDISSIL